MSAAEAVATFQVPPGFEVTLLAAEPDVQQPIAATTDARGRLWVVENYTYADSSIGFDTNLRDRILIFEDTDGDGQFDRRKVFWDQGIRMTSVELGRGGVFALCPPQLLFIPDRDQDDSPDGPPVVLLDGFETTPGNRHTFANGLKWGPDGWLWGRVGISSHARVGKPGTPQAERVEIRGGIWRYHPDRAVFEVLCHGTTNPWGLDWTENGEPFFINTVIGHLWHAIPGAHFQRMHGEDVRARGYAWIGQHADHYHFETGAGWMSSRASDTGQVAGNSDALGGGHAHSGLIIVSGPPWPESWHGKLLTLNLHGRRINVERLERSGSGFIGRHEPDFIQFGDPWFRGIDLVPGPSGQVYILDWSDTGECHEHDGVHRTSGRVYVLKPSGTEKPEGSAAVTRSSVSESLQTLGSLMSAENDSQSATLWVNAMVHSDEWVVRQARILLADRVADDRVPDGLVERIQSRLNAETSVREKLRLLWALNTLDALSTESLLEWTHRKDEALQSWAVRLLVDRLAFGSGETTPVIPSTLRPDVLSRLIELAREGANTAGLTRLYLASALQRIPFAQRAELAVALIGHADVAEDTNLPLLIWYGVEPLLEQDLHRAPHLLSGCEVPLIRRYLTRRVAEEWESDPGALERILERAPAFETAAKQDILAGMHEAFQGWAQVSAPKGWPPFVAGLDSGEEFQQHVRELSLLFGDGRALEDLLAIARNTALDADRRRRALLAAGDGPVETLVPVWKALADDGALRSTALVLLLRAGVADAPRMALQRYQWLAKAERNSIVHAMVTRPESALALLDAVLAGRVARDVIQPFHARQMAGLGHEELTTRLHSVWGVVRSENARSESVRQQIENMHGRLTPERLATADLDRGRELYRERCGTCHKLHGEGGVLGPDLTGSGRADLGYLLENIMDPSAVVAADYQLAVVALKDGRTLNGLLRERNPRTWTLETLDGAVHIDRSEVESVERLEASLMPDGLLEDLDESQVRDLIAFLMGSDVPESSEASDTD